MTAPDLPPLLASPVKRPQSTWLAWACIVVWVLYIFGRNYEASEAVTPNGPAPLAHLQFKMMARTILTLNKFKRMGSQKTGGTKPNSRQEREMAQLDLLAQTPEDKLEAAILIGEMLGSDAALPRLDALAKEPTPPEVKTDIDTLRTLYTLGVNHVSDEGKQALVDHHGLVGEVALVYGLPPTAEARQALENSAVSRMTIVGLGLLIGAGLTLVCSIAAIVMACTGRIRRAYQPEPTAGPAYLEGFALYLTLYFLFGKLLGMLHADPLVWIWPALLILPLVLAWTARRGTTREQRKNAFGWQTGQGAHIEIFYGLAGFFALVPFEILGVGLSLVLIKIAGAHPSHPIAGWIEEGGGWWHILALYGVACVLAPVLEETMFRGALFHHLRRRWSWLPSALLVAFIFAIIHPQGWTLVPGLGAVAMNLAALREWRGSILASMTAHACNNFLAVSAGLLLFT